MPVFEYRCDGCASRFEIIVFGKPERPCCPACGNTQVDRLLSSFAVSRGEGGRPREPGPCPCGAPERGACSRGEH